MDFFAKYFLAFLTIIEPFCLYLVSLKKKNVLLQIVRQSLSEAGTVRFDVLGVICVMYTYCFACINDLRFGESLIKLLFDFRQNVSQHYEMCILAPDVYRLLVYYLTTIIIVTCALLSFLRNFTV